MGDRALIQLKAGEDVSPVLYLHWGGSRVSEIIRATESRMGNRAGDTSYSFARLVQSAVGDDKYDTGFGVWNHTETLTEADSHGDAGCFVVDISEKTWKVEAFGGYGLESH